MNNTNEQNFIYYRQENKLKQKAKYTCYPTDNNIYWKNQTDLELERILKEIKYYKSLNLSLKNLKYFQKEENPKISLIITIYNQGYYIEKLYWSILNQELKNIEIIFIDDASSDNSSLIIKQLIKKDKRIVYLKNKINKGQYYSINKGVLNSKGEYILSIDADDLLINNILIKVYETAKKYNLDVLQFYMILNNYLGKFKYKSGIVCDNINVRNIFYYGETRNLPDKLIKRQIYIKSIHFMPKILYNEDYYIHTDDTTFFGIIHFIDSYGFLEQIGYYYNNEPNRKPKQFIKEDKTMKSNREIKSLFNIMKYFILKSDNNTIEKNNMPYKFFEKKVKNILKKDLKYLSKHFEFYIDVFNLFLNCPFFNKDKKKVLLKFKRKVLLKQRYYK